MEESEFEQGEPAVKITQSSNLVYNILELEADRFFDLKSEQQDLYFKDPSSGEFIKVADAFNEEIERLHKEMMKKKRMRFFITFSETMDMEDELKPIALKIIRMFARQMSYGNIVKGVGFSDLMEVLGTSSRYITSGIEQLLEKDVVRYKVVKNRRVYMINPVLYFKGSTMGIYKAVRTYKTFPTHMVE